MKKIILHPLGPMIASTILVPIADYWNCSRYVFALAVLLAGFNLGFVYAVSLSVRSSPIRSEDQP
jgi:hypothetical protein